MSEGDGTLCSSTDHFPPTETQDRDDGLPSPAGFISGLEQGRFPLAGFVLRSPHDYLEGRQPGNTSADDANIHGVPADRSFIGPYTIGVTRSFVHLRRAC